MPVNVITLPVSSSVVTNCATATGGSFLSCTVMVTVAISDSTVPSFTSNEKLSDPTYWGFGV